MKPATAKITVLAAVGEPDIESALESAYALISPYLDNETQGRPVLAIVQGPKRHLDRLAALGN